MRPTTETLTKHAQVAWLRQFQMNDGRKNVGKRASNLTKLHKLLMR